MEIEPITTGKTEDKVEFATAFKAIQVALDNYQDIFSDFDTGPYNYRTLSNDFVNEVERRYVETKPGEFEVRLTLPAKERDQRVEMVIKKRLRDYFTGRLKEKDEEITKKRNIGIVRILAGIVIIISVLELPIADSAAVSNILFVPGWFFIWSGFENIMDIPGKLAEERQFLSRFSKAKYHFYSEDELTVVAEKLPEPPPVPPLEPRHT